MYNRKIFITLSISTLIGLNGCRLPKQIPVSSPETHAKQWVDSVFKTLNKRQKIAQLLMIRVNSNKNKHYEDSIIKIVNREQVGGVVFFQGGPKRQASLTNRLQQVAQVPLLVATDAEWGLGMRLDSANAFPFAMTLGAIRNNLLIYQMGREIGKDLKAIGVGLNFAPVVDVNNNANNPVINFRSFGENKENVAYKGIAYMAGLQAENVIATAKHFPGHGDTDIDSHHDLPSLKHNSIRLDSLEMYPFKQLIEAGVGGIMVAHINIPSLDSSLNIPSSLSKPIITGILKNKIGFKGLIISDAMDMKGVIKFFPNGSADVKAIEAGNDIIELSENSQRAIQQIRKAIRNHRLSWADIDEKVKKILHTKYEIGLSNSKIQKKGLLFYLRSLFSRPNIRMIDTNGLTNFYNRPAINALKNQLCEAAITQLRNHNLPIDSNIHQPIACLSIGSKSITVFQQEIAQQDSVTFFNLDKQATLAEIETTKQQLKKYSLIIIGVHDTRKFPRNRLDYNESTLAFINELTTSNAIISWFANPYSLAQCSTISQTKGLLIGYQNIPEIQKAAVKIIFGQLKPQGKLPVSVGSTFKFGEGE